MTILYLRKNICVPLKYEKPLPRQRVFYLGVIYTGPEQCQNEMKLYLERHGKKNGVRKWSLITYDKYDEYDKHKYSIELDRCDEDDVPDMLCQFYIGEHITFNDLRKFGWKGKVYQNAEIINFKKD